MTATVLAADVGTSSLKAALVQEDGRILATARRSYRTRIPEDGWTEQDPEDWLGALAGAVNDLAVETPLPALAGLVLTGQMSAGLLVDREAKPLTPCLIWSDQRAGAEAQAAEAAFGGDAIYRLTGNPASASYTASKLAWLLKHAPRAGDSAAAFLQPKDWLVARLTGRFATDHSDASCTGLLDFGAGTWSPDLLGLYGIRAELAPEILPSTAIAGSLKGEMAARLGLTAGLPVVIGGGDGPVAAAGSGAVADGEAYASLGTSAWISFVTGTPNLEPGSSLATFAHVVPGLSLETGSMQSAGAALEWAAALFGTEPGALAEMVLAAPPPTPRAPLFLPYLQGERTPWWFSHSGGSFLGLGRAHGRAEMAAAVFEGVLFQLRTILDVFARQGRRADCLTVAGTFGRADRFAQRLADATDQPVRILRNAEHATALGAAMLGFTGLGRFASVEEARGWIAYQETRRCGPDARLARERYEIFAGAWEQLGAPTAKLAGLGRGGQSDSEIG